MVTNQQNESYRWIPSSSPQDIPLRHFDGHTHDECFGVLVRKELRLQQASEVQDPKQARYSPLSFTTVSYETIRGHHAVVLSRNTGSKYKVYFDNDNSLAYLGFDSDDCGVVVTYARQPGLAYPIPAKWEFWRLDPNRKKNVINEITVDSFENYTPHRDEFDIEKRFGLKPLPMPPRPDGAGAGTSSAGSGVAGRRATGLLIAAGLCALGGLIVVWRRRRRHRSRTASPRSA